MLGVGARECKIPFFRARWKRTARRVLGEGPRGRETPFFRARWERTARRVLGFDQFWSSLFSNKTKIPANTYNNQIALYIRPHPSTARSSVLNLLTTSLATRCASRILYFDRGREQWTDVMGLEYRVQWWVLFLVL